MVTLPPPIRPQFRVVTLNWCAAQSPWRIGIPLAALRREGYHVLEIAGLADADRLQDGDVLVIHQPSHSGIVELIRVARDRGMSVVIDVDDLLLSGLLPAHARFARYWDPLFHRHAARKRVEAGLDDHDAIASAPINDALDTLRTCVRSADAVTVPTAALAAAFQELNPSIHLLPNCWDDANPLWSLSPPVRSTINVGFLGTEHHRPNLDLLTGVLEPILDAFPSVRIVEAGQGNLIERIRAAPERLLHLGWLPFETYPLLVHQVDIMLAPLVDEPFMRCKSNIRCMTAGLVGAPVVASPVEPYRCYIADGINGFLASTTTEWIDALRTLVVDAELRRSMGEANREQARSYAISANIEKWIHLYGSVHSRRCCA